MNYIGYIIALVAVMEAVSFLITHWLITRRQANIVYAKLLSLAIVAGFIVLCAVIATPARAGGLTDVAKCTIDANNRLPVGPELKEAERKCYQILPPKVAKDAHDHRGTLREDHERRLVIEVRCGPRSLGTVPTPLARC